MALFLESLSMIYTFTRLARLAANSLERMHIVGLYLRLEMHGQSLLIG